MGLSIIDGPNYFVINDDDDGHVFYFQIGTAAGSNGSVATMPYTTGTAAPDVVIVGQRTSNSPIAVADSAATLTTTGCTIFSRFTRTNNVANHNAYVTYVWIRTGTKSYVDGATRVDIADTPDGRYCALYDNNVLQALFQAEVKVSDSDGSESDWNFPMECPDTDYAVHSTNSGNNWYVSGSIPKTTTTAGFRTWNEFTQIGSRATYLLCTWIKG